MLVDPIYNCSANSKLVTKLLLMSTRALTTYSTTFLLTYLEHYSALRTRVLRK